MGGTDAVEPLIAALGDDHASVRLAATEALGKIGAPGSVEPLIGALGSRAVEIRKAAADSLGRIGDSRALDPLVACLIDASWSVRRAAAEALGRIGDPRAAEPLKVAFKDSDSNVRSAAAEALGALGLRPKGTVDESPKGPRRRIEISRRRFPSGGHRLTSIDATGRPNCETRSDARSRLRCRPRETIFSHRVISHLDHLDPAAAPFALTGLPAHSEQQCLRPSARANAKRGAGHGLPKVTTPSTRLGRAPPRLDLFPRRT